MLHFIPYWLFYLIFFQYFSYERIGQNAPIQSIHCWYGTGSIAIAIITKDSILLFTDGRTLDTEGRIFSDSTVKTGCVNSMIYAVTGTDRIEKVKSIHLTNDFCAIVNTPVEANIKIASFLKDSICPIINRLSPSAQACIMDTTTFGHPYFKSIICKFIDNIPIVSTGEFGFIRFSGIIKATFDTINFNSIDDFRRANPIILGERDIIDSVLISDPRFWDRGIVTGAKELIRASGKKHKEIGGIIRLMTLNKNGKCLYISNL